MKPKIIVIVGPTASGKTGLSIELAKAFQGEVISADSRQVYRRLDIGTEKVTEEEMQGVPHHLIDVVDVNAVYTAVDFKRDARKAIGTIVARNHLPIIAGGTFFYIDTLLGRIQLPEVPPDEALRARLEELSLEELRSELEELDPERLKNLDQDNPRRLMRAIEIATVLGKVPETTVEECPYDVLMIGIETDRTELRARIRARAASAIERGLVTETVTLLYPTRELVNTHVKRDLTLSLPKQPVDPVSESRLSEIGLEYREIIHYLKDSTITNQNLIDRLEQVNWQYAKRQLTWLKRDDSIKWFAREDVDAIKTTAQKFLSE